MSLSGSSLVNTYMCHLLSSVVSSLVISLKRTWWRHRREMLLIRDSSTLGRTSLLPNLTRKRRMGRSVRSAVLTSTPSWVLTPSSTGRCLQCLSVHLYTHLHTYPAQRPAPTDHSYVKLCLRMYTCTHTYIMYIHHKALTQCTHTMYTAHTLTILPPWDKHSHSVTASPSLSLPGRVPRSHPLHPHVPQQHQHRCGHPMHHPAVPLPHLTAGIRYRR